MGIKVSSINRFFVVFALHLLILQTAPARDAAAPRVGEIKADLVIKNINVIDVRTGKVRYSVDVIIRKENIHKIEKSKKSNRYEALQIVDGTGKFLIPGLWDMHTHVTGNYKDFFPLLLANGVLGIREMFGNPSEIGKIREKIGNGEIDGPMIVTSGAIIDGKPPTWGSSAVAETPEQGRDRPKTKRRRGRIHQGLFQSEKGRVPGDRG